MGSNLIRCTVRVKLCNVVHMERSKTWWLSAHSRATFRCLASLKIAQFNQFFDRDQQSSTSTSQCGWDGGLRGVSNDRDFVTIFSMNTSQTVETGCSGVVPIFNPNHNASKTLTKRSKIDTSTPSWLSWSDEHWIHYTWVQSRFAGAGEIHRESVGRYLRRPSEVSPEMLREFCTTDGRRRSPLHTLGPVTIFGCT